MKKQVMIRAWQIIKAAVAQNGGKCRDYSFSAALRYAWEEVKMTSINLKKVDTENLPTMPAVSDKQREYAENLRHAKAISYNQYVDAYTAATKTTGAAKEQLKARVTALNEFDTYVSRKDRISLDGNAFDLQSAVKYLSRKAYKQVKAGADAETAYSAAIQQADELAESIYGYMASVLTSTTLTAAEYLDSKY